MSATSGTSGAEAIDAGALAAVGLFAELDVEEREAIAALCRPAICTAGSWIIGTQDAEHSVFFLLEGSAEVVSHNLIGDSIHLGALEPGCYLGELSALDGGPRTAEVRAVTDCRLAAMAPSDFRRVLAAYPAVTVMVMRDLARMVRQANMTVLQHATV